MMLAWYNHDYCRFRSHIRVALGAFSSVGRATDF
jgi:hypothetical protein